MLQKLRDKTSGWIVTVIMGLLMIPFLFVIDNSYLGGVGAQNVAKVSAPPSWWTSAPSWWPMSFLWKHHEVSVEDFRTRFEQARMQAREQQGDNFDPREFETTENKRLVLDQLIDEQVVRLAAEDAHIVIGDNAVRDYIAAIPGFQKDGKFDPDQYRLALAQSMPPRTPAMFEQLVRTSLQQSIIPSALAESGFTTKGESERLLKLLGETRDVEFALLPAVAADTAAVTDAEIDQGNKAHPKDFRQPESATIEYVEINAASMPAVTAADEATLRQRYEDEKMRFVSADQRLASHILIATGSDEKAAEAKAAKLAAEAKQPGADFAALAKANSEDPGSKDAGGDLGWVEKGVMDKSFEDALFAMKAGDVVGPVKSAFGYHVLQLREIKGGEGRPFEEVREPACRRAAGGRYREGVQRAERSLGRSGLQEPDRTGRRSQGSWPAGADPGPVQPCHRQRHRCQSGSAEGRVLRRVEGRRHGQRSDRACPEPQRDGPRDRAHPGAGHPAGAGARAGDCCCACAPHRGGFEEGC